MRPSVHLPDTLAGQVRVDLGGADAGMTQQLLDDAEVRPALQEVRGERVAERVGRRASLQAGSRAPRASRRPRPADVSAAVPGCRGRPARRGAAGAAWRARRDGRTSDVVAAQPVDRDLADREEPLPVALPDHPDCCGVEVEVVGIEPRRLADPQAGGIQQLQQGTRRGSAPRRASHPARRRGPRRRGAGRRPRSPAGPAGGAARGAGRDARPRRPGPVPPQARSGRTLGSPPSCAVGSSRAVGPRMDRPCSRAAPGRRPPGRPSAPTRPAPPRSPRNRGRSAP